MEKNPAQLEDAFYKDLEFGTGGMRGVMGIGTNRINKYTLGASTQGLSNYLKAHFPNQIISVAIAHDCRNNSRLFAELVADVFSANEIQVYLFEDLRPTPELSFAVRELGCQAGVVLTASHNPPEYNGYKVYWEDGAQIVTPHDKGIIEEVQSVESIDDILFEGNKALIHSLGEEMDRKFWNACLDNSFTNAGKKDLKIVFTSIHGTSIMAVPQVLERAGFKHVSVVEEQAVPDGNFPTVESPNPEESAALKMALDQADREGADIVVGTDPDADRIGIAIRNGKGEMELLNGNQTGVLMTEFLLRNWKQNGRLTGKEFIAYTIVSSDLFKDVSDHYGVETEVCLTGFKHIAKLIRDNEGRRTYIGGGEESYGYMVGDFVRDKDSVTSTLVVCEMAAEAKANGRLLMDELEDIYRRHGVYREHLISLVKKGKDGAAEIARMMDDFRNNPPSKIAGEDIVSIADYDSGIHKDLRDGSETIIELPKSNVLQFFTDAGSKISARPSGTEPKIKFYYSFRTDLGSEENMKDTWDGLGKKIDAASIDLGLS